MEAPTLLPAGARMALSITFDDARESQLHVAAPILRAHQVRATFYVLPEAVERRAAEWRALAAAGHEIGNHSTTHPCSGNFGFSRHNALEDYTLDAVGADIDAASGRIHRLFGARPTTFAYPCGQSFVGRGESRASYVPLVARRFVAGRGCGSEAANDLGRCDLAHLEAFVADGLGGDAIVDLVERGVADYRWVVLAGHDVGGGGEQTVLDSALEALCRRAARADVWAAPVAEVAGRLRQLRR